MHLNVSGMKMILAAFITIDRNPASDCSVCQLLIHDICHNSHVYCIFQMYIFGELEIEVITFS